MFARNVHATWRLSSPAVANVAYVASLVSSRTWTPLTAAAFTPDTKVRTCSKHQNNHVENPWPNDPTLLPVALLLNPCHCCCIYI
jgi:hypothetical protein